MTVLTTPFRFVFLCGLGLALAVLLPQPEPRAQDLQSQIERLQRELNDLQSYVYRGGGTSGGASSAPLPAGGAASFQVRLDEMEASLRQLRGQLEEMSFRIRETNDRMERFIADAEYRLTVLEGGDPAQLSSNAATGSSQSSSFQAASQAAPQASSGNAAVSSGGAASASGGAQVGSLGQVSENDVAAIQQRSTTSAPAETSSSGASQSSGQTASVPPAAAAALPGGTPEEQYNHALGLLRETRFDEAQVALDSFLEKNPGHGLAANAAYWLGETYYVRADYRNAAVTFAQGFKDHPQGSKAPANLLKLGMSLAHLDEKENACATFLQLQQRFPNADNNILQKAQLERQRNGC